MPVALVVRFGPAHGLGEWTSPAPALAAFLGHLWPVFFGFKGGKGVATAAGALFGIDPLLGAATLATWLIIVAFFRYSSLASIVAAVFAPFCYLLTDGPDAIALAVFCDGALLDLAPQRQHQAPVRGHREPARQEGRRRAGARQATARRAPLTPPGAGSRCRARLSS